MTTEKSPQFTRSVGLPRGWTRALRFIFLDPTPYESLVVCVRFGKFF